MREDWTKRCYYDLLQRFKDRYGLTFYAYHFMENHTHLVGRLRTVEEFSDFFRTVHNLFSRFLNRKFKKCGQVIMDRPKSPMINDDYHLLSVLIYSDINAVKAGRDQRAEDSEWSSYKFYAYGKADDLLTPAPIYMDLAKGPKGRQEEYRWLVRSRIETLKKEND